MVARLLVLASTVLLASASEKRFVKWGENEEPVWMTEAEIEDRRAAVRDKTGNAWVSFMDMTDHNMTFQGVPVRFAESPIPTQPLRQSEVIPLLAQVNQAAIRETIRHLSEDYHTRHRGHQEGIDAAHWIRDQFIRMAAGRSDVSVQLYTHPSIRQPSVIARIEGSSDEIVVIGAHFDSTAGAATARAPGADDDGSGTACILEAFRVLMTSNWRPRRTVEFMAFAGEEGGLIGSRDIVARKFQGGNVPLMSMLNLEMNGYQVVPQITVLNDGATTPSMVRLLGTYVSTYTSGTYRLNNAQCGYSCSDHVPFSNAGYRVTCIAEDGPFGYVNPNMHTSRDTLQHINMPQTEQHARLAIAYVVELSYAPES